MSWWPKVQTILTALGSVLVVITALTALVKTTFDVWAAIEKRLAKRRARQRRAALEQDLELLILELRQARRGFPPIDELEVTDRAETAWLGYRLNLLDEPRGRDGRLYARLRR